MVCDYSLERGLAAGHDSSPQATENLERLCRTYWYPLYAFLRRKGYGPHEAEDLTQGFFARFWRSATWTTLTATEGNSGAFCFARWTTSSPMSGTSPAAQTRWWHRLLPLETALAEERYQLEPETLHRPEVLFDRGWAQTLLAVVLRRLRRNTSKPKAPICPTEAVSARRAGPGQVCHCLSTARNEGAGHQVGRLSPAPPLSGPLSRRNSADRGDPCRRG